MSTPVRVENSYERAAVAEVLSVRVGELVEELGRTGVFVHEAFQHVPEDAIQQQISGIEALDEMLPALRSLLDAQPEIRLPFDEQQTHEQLGAVLRSVCDGICEHEDDAADYGRAISAIAEMRAGLAVTA